MSGAVNPSSSLPRGFILFKHAGITFGYNPATGQGVRWLAKSGSAGAANTWNLINYTSKFASVSIKGASQRWHLIVAKRFLNGGKDIPADVRVVHIVSAWGGAYQDRLDNLVMRRGSAPREARELRRSRRYEGVGWDTDSRKWIAYSANRITGEYEQIATFTDEREAAKAYVNFCTKHGLSCSPTTEALKLDETDYRQLN